MANQNQQKEIIKTFVLGNKELEGKTAEFQYDHGWYTIYDIVGEEKMIVFKSKNAQESYTKWNVYIGRKKERPQRELPQETERDNDRKREQQETRRQEKKNTDRRNARYSDLDKEDMIAGQERCGGEKSHSRNRSRSRNRNRNKNSGARGGSN